MSEAKKTPSPKVIASYMIREVLTNAPNNFTPEQVTSLVDSRVSDAKYDKVKEQFEKITQKFRQRLENTIHKFETPAGKKKADKGKKKLTDESVAKTTAVLKKKKKKKNRD